MHQVGGMGWTGTEAAAGKKVGQWICMCRVYRFQISLRASLYPKNQWHDHPWRHHHGQLWGEVTLHQCTSTRGPASGPKKAGTGWNATRTDDHEHWFDTDAAGKMPQRHVLHVWRGILPAKWGCSNGLPLSPILANLLMEEFEEEAIDTTQMKPALWLRYVGLNIMVIMVIMIIAHP